MPVPENYKHTDTAGDSKHLRAADFNIDTKWRLTIEDVNLEEMEGREGKSARKRLIVAFQGREKTFVLNATNQSFLEERMGFNPNDWIGATVVLWRTTTKFEGKSVPAFRFLEAKKAATRPAQKPKPAPEPVEVDPIDEGQEYGAGDESDVPF